jgi:hypothetical protein
VPSVKSTSRTSATGSAAAVAGVAVPGATARREPVRAAAATVASIERQRVLWRFTEGFLFGSIRWGPEQALGVR